jgi:hypothetical protein
VPYAFNKSFLRIEGMPLEKQTYFWRDECAIIKAIIKSSD